MVFGPCYRNPAWSVDRLRHCDDRRNAALVGNSIPPGSGSGAIELSDGLGSI